MKVLAVIPARFASTRFPGKPLEKIGDKPMIQHVYERCVGSKLFTETVVATDDERIKDAVLGFNGQVIMTDASHESGTDRCFEALAGSYSQFDALVNIQGDEPFISTESLKEVVRLLESGAEIATLTVKATSLEQVRDSNKVKVVLSQSGKALYFSRSPVPFVRDVPENQWLESQDFYIHLGIYGFNTRVVPQIKRLKVSLLEKTEKLEQLRWLENGFSVDCGTVKELPFGVDTPSDLEEANRRIKLAL